MPYTSSNCGLLPYCAVYIAQSTWLFGYFLPFFDAVPLAVVSLAIANAYSTELEYIFDHLSLRVSVSSLIAQRMVIRSAFLVQRWEI